MAQHFDPVNLTCMNSTLCEAIFAKEDTAGQAASQTGVHRSAASKNRPHPSHFEDNTSASHENVLLRPEQLSPFKLAYYTLIKHYNSDEGCNKLSV